MIRLAINTTIIRSRDGSSHALDSESLQKDIARSLRACGAADAWIAEDIVLGLEYVLAQLRGGEATFTDGEINSCVSKILDVAGYPQAAAHFLGSAGRRDDTPSASPKEVIAKYLMLEGAELDSLSIKVESALRILSVKDAPFTLVIELARLYRPAATVEAASIPLRRMDGSAGPWSVRREDILVKAGQESMDMVAKGVIGLSGVSRLFPSLKFELNLIPLARSCGTTAPATELVLYPGLVLAARAIDEISGIAGSLYSAGEKSGAVLPAYVKIPDQDAFAVEFLQLGRAESAKVLQGMAAFLCEHAGRPLIFRNLPS